MKLPISRATDVVVQDLGKETLIYDLITHKAYNLNETSSIVYNACDGKTSLAELKRKSNFTDEIIFLALDELKRENLIEDNSFVSPLTGMNRREVIRKVGFASMIALPLIVSLTAPPAIYAASCSGTNPRGTATCASNCFPIGSSCCSTVATSCQSCQTTSSQSNTCVTPQNPSGILCTCT